MRKCYLMLIALIIITMGSFAQPLTGIKNIPGDYATVTLAVADLNTQGVGAGGVTFNIAGGYTETLTGKLTVTATGTVANPIIFQKSGAGANPVLTSYVGTVSTPSTIADGFFVLAGSDYVTINGLDLLESAANTTTTAVMEFGYGLFKASVTNGCQNNTIMNCTITLNRVQNTAWTAPGHNGSTGIAVLNGLNTASGALTITAASGANSNNVLYSNTIQNCNAGIVFIGYTDVSPYTLADQGNDIGGASLANGNTILNFGGGAATNPSSGIFMNNQYAFNCSYNTINNNNGSGVNHATTLRGIFYNSSGAGAFGSLNNNIITVTCGATTSQLAGIEMAAGTGTTNTININNNTITTGYPTATSGVSYGVYINTSTPGNLNINGNTLSMTTAATSGSLYGIYSTSAVATALNVNTNIFTSFNLSAASTSATVRGIYLTAAGSSSSTSINGNNFNAITYAGATGGSGETDCIYYSGTSLSSTINNNNFNNLTLKTTGTVYLIYNSFSASANGTKTVQGNMVNTGVTRNGAGSSSFYGYYDNGTSPSTVNHIISGNTFTGLNNGTSSGTLYGISSTDYSGSNPGLTLYNNTITNLTSTAAPVYGMNLNGIGGSLATPNEVYSNIINNLSGGSASSTYGLYIGSQLLYCNVYSNTINTISSNGAGGVNGLYLTGSTNIINAYRNKIYDISGSNAGSIVTGVYLTGGTTMNVYNNLVGDIKATAATGNAAISGIQVAGGTAVNLHFNTVNIDATSSSATTFGTSALYVSTTGTTVTSRDNIFVNTSAPGPTGGFSAAFRYTIAPGAAYATASNNNLFYAGTAAANKLIYGETATSTATNGQQTLSAYKIYIGGVKDGSSVYEAPPYLSTAGSNSNFLHINTTIATQIESGGTPVSGVSNDYDNDTRSITLPDIGADEFSGIALDITAPAIVYTPLTNACTSGVRTLTATISDASGVPQAGAGLPTAYFKINAGAYTAVTATWVSGNNYTFPIGTGSVAGDVISYYVVAQDNAGTPNVGAFPIAGAAGFTANPPAAATPPTTPSSYTALVTLIGNYNVGVGQPYTTLTAAVNDWNTKCISGAVTFTLKDATYPSETYPITINANIASSVSNTLTILPDAAIAAPILFTSTVATTATIDFNGAGYVTIDGRPGGTGSNKYIIIENTSTTAATAGNAILLRNEASNNTLTYLDIRSANQNLPANTAITTAGAIPGAIAIGSTTGTNGNDNNTVSYCNVHSTATALLGVSIYAGNATTGGNASNNDNDIITNCNVYDFFIAGSASAGINISQGNNNWVVNNNSVYQTAKRTYTGTQTVRGFWITPNIASLTSASGYDISGNFIGGTAPNCGGTPMILTGTTAWLYNGMDISLGSGTVSSVQNNTITNIRDTSGSTGSVAFVGINMANGNINVGTITGNVIGSATVTGSIIFTATANTGGFAGIRTGSGQTINIANNIISGIDVTGSVLTVAAIFNGIAASGGVTVNITNNTIGSATLVNSINASSASTSTSIQSIRGIIVNGTGTVSTISGNTVANINTNLVATGTQATTLVGISVPSGAGACTISNNIIRNLSSSTQTTSGGTTAAIVGISYAGILAPAVISGNNISVLKLTHPSATAGITNQAIAYAGPTTGTNLIEKNNIHSISMASPTNSTGFLSGMDIGSGLVTIQNNMIRMGLDSSGNSIVSPCTVRGITKFSASTSLYHNSIYIGGTGVGTTATNTFAFVRTSTGVDDIRDNIFVNNRSNATTGGKHYQVNLTNSTTTLTLNNNVYFGNGTGNVFGFNATADVAAYTTGWVSGDINSFASDPMYLNPTGTAATGDLHINPAIASAVETNGALIASVTDDFDGQARAGLSPTDIGADAGNFTPVAFMAFKSSTTTQANVTTVPSNSTNQVVIGVEVETTGLTNPLVASAFNFTNTGTALATDITNAKLFYTAGSAVFATGTQVGSTVASPLGAFSFTTTQILNSGFNYFWLTYDVPCTAAAGNSIDASCNSVTVGSAQVPTVQAPAGSRTIVSGPLSGVKTIGGTGTPDYATLNAAMSAINTLGLGGNITLNVMANITEPAQVVINKWTECGGSGFTLTIKPNTTATISGAVSSNSLIKINGAGKVVIDGSNSGGSDRSLTITNTGTTAPTAVSLASLGTGLGASFNTIKNCNISTGVNSTAGYGIAVGGATPGSSGADNDNVTLQNNNISVATIGIYAVGTAAVSTGGNDNLAITGNSIDYNGTLASIGIQAGNALSSSISQNTVSEQTSTSQSPTGISLETGFVSSTVTRNTVSKAATSSTGGYGGRGITVGTGTATSNLTIANNQIYGINGSNWSAFSNSSSMGIGIGMIGSSSTITTVAGGINLYYNSVNLYSTFSNTTACITAALYIGTGASALDIRNNIFVNTLNNTGTGTTSKAYAIYSAAANTAFTTINNNIYDTVATQGILGFIGSDRGDIGAWRTGSGQDVNSLSASPLFNSNTALQPQTGSPAAAAGTPVSVTIDFTGAARSGTNPTIGAYESLGDGTAPLITYSTLGNSLCISNRALSATITDASGVNNTAGTLPRIYYKKSTNLNVLGGTNDNTTNGWKYTEALNTSSPFNFNIDVSLINGGLVSGETVQYFVVAQDLAPTPNVAINNGTFNAVPATVGLSGTAFPIGGTINSYLLLAGGISGSVSVGATASTYTSITGTGGLFDVINNGGLLGNTTVLINDANLTETGTVALNAISYGCASNFTLTIRPNTGINTVITGAVGTGAVIKLNGADYVTFDGSNNATTSRNMTIRNTTTTTSGNAVLWLASPATGNGAANNTFKNCIIEGDASTTTFTGVYVGGSTTITLTAAGNELNSNNTFSNNLFRKTQYGLTMFGFAAASPDQNNVIINNNFGTAVAAEGFSLEGIHTDRQENLLVSGNEVQNVKGTSATNMFGIRLLDFKTGTCIKNKVHDIAYTGTSTTKNYGIEVLSSTYTTVGNPSNALIANNFVYAINSTGTSAVWNVTGILASSGYGDRYYHNTVDLSGQLNNSTTGLSAAFANGDDNITTFCNNIDVRNNIFNLSGSSAGGNVWAYYSRATNFTGATQNNNLLRCAGTGATNNTGRLNAISYTTLPLWQAGSGVDGNSVSTTPVFISATNLHLDPGSNAAIDNLGTAVSGVTDDIDGDIRNVTTPDMGADEFTGIACSAAIGGTAAGNASGCQSFTGNITASGYSLGSGSTYQWVSATNPAGPWTAISGATNQTSYTINPAITTTTYFKLAVACATNSSFDSSTVVTITINPKPSVPVTPATPAAVCAPATISLSASGTNAATPSYQWLSSNVVIGGATSATYTAAATGSYRVRVVNGVTGCFDTSVVVPVIINPQPTAITITPSSVVICPAGAAQLLTASGATVNSSVSYSSGSINLLIPDNSSSGVSNSLAVSGIPVAATIDSVVVTFNSDQTFDADFEANLEAPNGQIINLVADQGSSGDFFTNTRVSSDATKPAFSSGTPPFTGTFKADANLQANLIGLPAVTTQTFSALFGTPNGNWTFRAYDDAAAITGSLLDWSIKIYYKEPINYVWTPNGAGNGLFTDAAASLVYSGAQTATVYTLPTATTTYTATATSGSGCTRTANVDVTVIPAGTSIWSGAVNTDWANAGNWSCGTVPTITSEVTIGAGKPNYPLINLNVEIKKLTVQPGATVTVATGFVLKLNGM